MKLPLFWKLLVHSDLNPYKGLHDPLSVLVPTQSPLSVSVPFINFVLYSGPSCCSPDTALTDLLLGMLFPDSPMPIPLLPPVCSHCHLLQGASPDYRNQHSNLPPYSSSPSPFLPRFLNFFIAVSI
ncbi:hypothetical protein MJG53_012849 [Ovis ammon polii x Ovis aries]|uniref:Uncharacterized protein n=1 Tax=Ovis ammon polii x Ovis aries TaxID=2918886 RepID=A0ACB9ULM0_9CETA|nr:hypothetical protein MJG53_012849 [Ovis ammon polii x Ovis aries]